MQDKILNELLDGKYAEARDRFAEGEHSHEDLTIIMLKHQTNHIAHLDQDVHDKIDDLGMKFTRKIDALNEKFTEQIDRLDNKIDALDEKFTAMFTSLHQTINNQSWKMMGMMAFMTGLFTFIVKY